MTSRTSTTSLIPCPTCLRSCSLLVRPSPKTQHLSRPWTLGVATAPRPSAGRAAECGPDVSALESDRAFDPLTTRRDRLVPAEEQGLAQKRDFCPPQAPGWRSVAFVGPDDGLYQRSLCTSMPCPRFHDMRLTPVTAIWEAAGDGGRNESANYTASTRAAREQYRKRHHK